MDNNDILRKAIYYKATHRGTKEADWLIGGFIKERLTEIPDKDILTLEILIDMDDESFFKQVDAPQAQYLDIINAFRSYKADL